MAGACLQGLLVPFVQLVVDIGTLIEREWSLREERGLEVAHSALELDYLNLDLLRLQASREKIPGSTADVI